MGEINSNPIIERGLTVHADNVDFAALSSEELDTIKKFEKEFATKHGNNIFLLAFNQDK